MKGRGSRLEIWRAAIDIAESVYQIVKTFPQAETDELTLPLQRAAMAVLSNIVEGKKRSSKKELAEFVSHFRRFLEEVERQINIANRLGYVDAEQAQFILRKATRAGQILMNRSELALSAAA
jgi:four helix bundle protein